VQREQYPSVAGMSRAEAYPALRHSGRPYLIQDEGRVWDLSQVDRFLADLTLHRRASARGVISIYGQGRNLGRLHRGKEVLVRFDPGPRQWVVTDLHGEELKRLAAAVNRSKGALRYRNILNSDVKRRQTTATSYRPEDPLSFGRLISCSTPFRRAA